MEYPRVLNFGVTSAAVAERPVATEVPGVGPGAPVAVPPAPSSRLQNARRNVASIGGLTGSLSLFLPGSGQLLFGEATRALFFGSLIAFLAVFARAMLLTVDRLVGTLLVLDRSVTWVLWTLLITYALTAAVHLWSVGDAVHARGEYHPAVPAVASAIVPGWGQILNAHRGRALVFLAGVWGVVGVWLITSDPATDLLNAVFPAVPAWEGLLRQPAIVWAARWTFPLLVWSLAVYDAASSASRRR